MSRPPLARLGLEPAEEAALAARALAAAKAAADAWSAVSRRCADPDADGAARAAHFDAAAACDRAVRELSRELVVQGSLLGAESFPALWAVAEAGHDARRAGEAARDALWAARALAGADEVAAAAAADVAAGLRRAGDLGSAPADESASAFARALAEDLDELAERSAARAERRLDPGEDDGAVRRALVLDAARRAAADAASFVRRWSGERP